jgi:hypothetical protein
MRDPKRIKPFLEKLGKYWEGRAPDWRFGQLMSNFLGFAWDRANRDIFFIEDDEMSRALDEFFNHEVGAGHEETTNKE